MIISYNSGIIKAKLDVGTKTLVNNVEFFIDVGKSLALIGETGSGKTIIACSIMKLLPQNVIDSTQIVFDGNELTNKNASKLLGNEIVYIPQSGQEFLNPSCTVKSQIYDSLKRVGVSRKDLHAQAVQKLQNVGFSDAEAVLKKYPFELSGGMAQRVVVAIATCSNAKLVIADEPTNGLEEDKKLEVLQLIRTLFPKASLLVISHDMDVAATCDEVLVLCKGNTMEQGSTEKILNSPTHPYTKALLQSSVKNGMHEVPKLRDGNSPCPFYSRCTCANEKCQQQIAIKIKDGIKYFCTL